MSRLHLTPPETIVPLKTAVRLLRIALTIKVVPILSDRDLAGAAR